MCSFQQIEVSAGVKRFFVLKRVFAFLCGLAGKWSVNVVSSLFGSKAVRGAGTAKCAGSLLTARRLHVIESKLAGLKILGLAVAACSGGLRIINGRAAKLFGQNTKETTGGVVLSSGSVSVLSVLRESGYRFTTLTMILKTALLITLCHSVTAVTGKCTAQNVCQKSKQANVFSSYGLLAELKSRRKSGTLQWESEVKACLKQQASRNDYQVILLAQTITLARGRDTRLSEKIVWTAANAKLQNSRIKSRLDNTESIPYQRGAKAIAREIMKSTNGKVQCDKDKAQRMIDDWYQDYKEVRDFVDDCKGLVITPGWLENPYGRRRRFLSHDSQSALAAQQREAVNFPIQSTVADTLNQAVQNLYYWREMFPGRASYKLLLAIHDAVLLEVPGESVDVVIDEVLPQCMKWGAQVPAWNLCNRTPTTPFRLDLDIEVSVRWGTKATADELTSRRVAERFVSRYGKKESKS